MKVFKDEFESYEKFAAEFATLACFLAYNTPQQANITQIVVKRSKYYLAIHSILTINSLDDLKPIDLSNSYLLDQDLELLQSLYNLKFGVASLPDEKLNLDGNFFIKINSASQPSRANIRRS